MGVIVIDAGVIIAILDAADAHHAAARAALQAALADGADLVLPASAYAEILVAPFRRSPGAAATVDSLVDALPASVQPVTRPIARAAAQLRARHGAKLRLPDALVVATAQELGAQSLLTTARRWPKVGVAIQVV